jgi:hypothetical protein
MIKIVEGMRPLSWKEIVKWKLVMHFKWSLTLHLDLNSVSFNYLDKSRKGCFLSFSVSLQFLRNHNNIGLESKNDTTTARENEKKANENWGSSSSVVWSTANLSNRKTEVHVQQEKSRKKKFETEKSINSKEKVKLILNVLYNCFEITHGKAQKIGRLLSKKANDPRSKLRSHGFCRLGPHNSGKCYITLLGNGRITRKTHT